MADTCLMYRYYQCFSTLLIFALVMLAGLKIFLFGQAFDFQNLTWSTIKLNTEPGPLENQDGIKLEVLPPLSGHSMVSC